MSNDSPALAIARANVDKAIREFTKVRAKEVADQEDPYVLAWGCFAEYTSVDYTDREVTGNIVIVPDDQIGSTSRGLFMFGADAFSRAIGS